MPSIYAYGRQVALGRSQVGTDRYKSGLSLDKSGLGLHKLGLIVTSCCYNVRPDKSGQSQREFGVKSWLIGATSELSRRGEKSGTFQRWPPSLLQNFKSGMSAS